MIKFQHKIELSWFVVHATSLTIVRKKGQATLRSHILGIETGHYVQDLNWVGPTSSVLKETSNGIDSSFDVICSHA